VQVHVLWIVLGWVGILSFMVLLVRAAGRRGRVRARVFASLPGEDTPVASTTDEGEKGWLGRWLGLAGYRSPAAVPTFVIATTVGLLAGVLVIVGLTQSGLPRSGAKFLTGLPGGVGEIFLPAIYLGPWIAGVVLATIPWLAVRAARRERVTLIEQDLSLFLELIATLSEAGLGFDAALDRILAAQLQRRPLADEFRQFQREALSGVPRVQALRRVALRADVLSLTILISALVQAEQVGAGVAEVLRRQADDLRGRRRERALSIAAALPVKLLFPLVICFLPGLFVATLGPTFYQFFQFADSIIQNRRFK